MKNNNMKYNIFKIILVIILLVALIYLLNMANSMENFTNKNKKYELVLYYASWCGHCKTLCEPDGSSIWDELTQKYKNHDKIEIKKVNEDTLSTEEKQKIGIKGYPTVILYKEQKLEYEGNRTIDDFDAFIKKHVN